MHSNPTEAQPHRFHYSSAYALLYTQLHSETTALDDTLSPDPWCTETFNSYCDALLKYARDETHARRWLSALLHFIPTPPPEAAQNTYAELYESITLPSDPLIAQTDSSPSIVLRHILRLLCPSSSYYDTTHLLMGIRKPYFSEAMHIREPAIDDMARMVRIICMHAIVQRLEQDTLDLDYTETNPSHQAIREALDTFLGLSRQPARISLDLDEAAYLDAQTDDLEFYMLACREPLQAWIQEARDFFGTEQSAWEHFCLSVLIQPQRFLEQCRGLSCELSALQRIAYLSLNLRHSFHPWIEESPVTVWCRLRHPEHNPYMLSERTQNKLHQRFLAVFLPHLFLIHKSCVSHSDPHTDLNTLLSMLSGLEHYPETGYTLSQKNLRQYVLYRERKAHIHPSESLVDRLLHWCSGMTQHVRGFFQARMPDLATLEQLQEARLSLSLSPQEIENLKRHGFLDLAPMEDIFSEPNACRAPSDRIV